VSRGVLTAARAVLLAGPTALAFFSGGYFDEPRVWAGVVVWLLVAIAAVAAPQSLPRGRSSWLALGGLAAFGAWTLLSIVWAPIAGSAYHAGQIVVLYLGAILAAALLLRERSWWRSVEPMLAAGTLIVVAYGISGRLLPGLLHFTQSISAEGRLEQPLTYWNAMGELAALGFVLCARVAGDSTRGPRLRVAAAAASAPLGMGLYLSFSRGALFACAAGIVALVVLAPRREQLEGLIVAIAAGALAAATAAPFGGVTSLAGRLSTREWQGAVVLVLLLAVIALASLAQWRLQGRRPEDDRLRLPRAAPWLAVGLICVGLAGAILVGAKEHSGPALSAGASRLTTLQSNRYAYWRVAAKAFAHEPLRGVGAGGWAVWWLRYRPFTESASDAHSLPLQTLAELGLVGLALLAVFLAGVGLAAARAMRGSPARAAGPVAVLVVYIAHAPLDWDWQMPAVTLVALVLAGMVIALAEDSTDARSRAAPRASGAERAAVLVGSETET
jgi:O-Antigen ligase